MLYQYATLSIDVVIHINSNILISDVIVDSVHVIRAQSFLVVLIL
jgi:hypothetical protein